MPNLHRPDFDEPRRGEGFRARRARVGRQAGCEKLGASLWELPPGQAAYPYHWHLAEEELIVVLEGRPKLRTPAGLRELEEGEVVSFPVGEGGAHQLVNDSGEVVRFLSLSTIADAEVCIYPDSGKLGAFDRKGRHGGLYELYRRADAVDYWEGETPPGGR